MYIFHSLFSLSLLRETPKLICSLCIETSPPGFSVWEWSVCPGTGLLQLPVPQGLGRSKLLHLLLLSCPYTR